MAWTARILGVVLAGTVAALATYETVPKSNTAQTHFDTIIVLGSPANPDGMPSDEQWARVTEGVLEFKKGRAGHIIMTGGAAHNHWVEAQVMAALAVREGVPKEDVIVEGQAINTIQNIWYSAQIMQGKGWTSAEVVSSHSHLPRTALILEHYRMQWQTHASHWPVQYSQARIAGYYAYEAMGTTVLRWFGFRRSRFIPEKTVS